MYNKVVYLFSKYVCLYTSIVEYICYYACTHILPVFI